MIEHTGNDVSEALQALVPEYGDEALIADGYGAHEDLVVRLQPVIDDLRQRIQAAECEAERLREALRQTAYVLSGCKLCLVQPSASLERDVHLALNEARAALTARVDASDEDDLDRLPRGDWAREEKLRHRLAQLRRAPHPYGAWAADILWRTDEEAEGPNPGVTPEEAPSQWRPIEMAPTDRTPVDLWDGEQRWTDMVWQSTSPMHPRGAWRKASADWWDAVSGLAPTHWMPPPPAPPETTT